MVISTTSLGQKHYGTTILSGLTIIVRYQLACGGNEHSTGISAAL